MILCLHDDVASQPQLVATIGLADLLTTLMHMESMVIYVHAIIKRARTPSGHISVAACLCMEGQNTAYITRPSISVLRCDLDRPHSDNGRIGG